MPVGRGVLRFTDRAYRIATSHNALIRWLRTTLAPDLVRLVLSSRRGRALAFRSLAQLAISYRDSPASQEGQPPLRTGPRAGDRLPDAPVIPYGQSADQPAPGPRPATVPPAGQRGLANWRCRARLFADLAYRRAPTNPAAPARSAPRPDGQSARTTGTHLA